MDLQIKKTKEYTKFKQMPGNRGVDKKHVKELVRHLTNHGNLTQNFPVIINENWEIIDGQHRIAALEILGWPVFYTLQPNLTIDTVRNINQAQRNWNWIDYATSYAELGNKEYEKFLQLVEDYGEQFNIMKQVCGTSTSGHNSFARDFKNGDLKIDDLIKVRERLEKLADIRELVPDLNRPGAYAILTFISHPDYSHERMLYKLKNYGEQLQQFSRERDMLRAFEDIYNYAAKDVVRLF